MAGSRKRRERRYRQSMPLLPRRLSLPRVEIDHALRWHVVWCQPQQEKRVAEELRERGLQTYRPIEKIELVKRGERKEIERTPLSRYVFVGLNTASPQFGLVREALEGAARKSGDFSFLWRGQEFWVPASNRVLDRPLGQILSIIDREREIDVPLVVPPAALERLADSLTLWGQSDSRTLAFRPGDRANVREGPFQGFLAEVEHADDVRVRALVNLFGGRVRAEFDPAQLEAA